jgi:hypothetical protein
MYDSAYILVVVLHVKLPAKKLVKYIFDDIVCSYFKISQLSTIITKLIPNYDLCYHFFWHRAGRVILELILPLHILKRATR